MDYVYIVMVGERNEGGWPVSVHTTLNSAYRAAQKEMRGQDSWIRENPDSLCWVNGCMVIRIISRKLQ